MNAKRLARLRVHLVEYSKTLSTLLDALTALQTVGLVSFKPAAINKALGQIETVLADIDTGEVDGRKLARWFSRLDNGNFVERFTVDEFIEQLGGPFLSTLAKGEKTWDRLHATWGHSFTDDDYEGASGEQEESE